MKDPTSSPPDTDESTEPTENLPDTPKTAPKGIPIADMIEYRSKGLSYAQVAKLVGCTKRNVIERLQTANREIDSAQNFKKHRADTFAVMGQKIINSFTPNDIKKMSGLQKATAVGIFYDKERLERDLSTENVAHEVLVGDMEDKRKAYEAAVQARMEATRDQDPDGEE